ncbi:MAG: phospholipase [Planctomycetes bacterium]|nr:phospholipase [Planctomycetota bacterium]
MDPRTELLAKRIADLVSDLPTSVAEELVSHLESLRDVTGSRLASDPAPPGFPFECRDQLDGVSSAWRSSGNEFSAKALGLAVLAAAQAVEAERSSERVELVWSGPTKPGTSLRRTEQALTELVQGARQEIWIVSYVAYSVVGIRDALVAALKRGVRVNLLLESRESGGGRISHDGIASLRSVVELGATVYEWPLEQRPRNRQGDPGALHAKFAVADAAILLLTSANLTESAFEFNIELGALLRGGPSPRRMTDKLHWLLATGQLVERDKQDGP